MEQARDTAGRWVGAPVRAVARAAAGTIGAEAAWRMLLAARHAVDRGQGHEPEAVLGFAFRGGSCTREHPARADLVVRPAAARIEAGWDALDPDARELCRLHLTQAVCPRPRGHVMAIMGQSLDGFIATRSG